MAKEALSFYDVKTKRSKREEGKILCSCKIWSRNSRMLESFI